MGTELTEIGPSDDGHRRTLIAYRDALSQVQYDVSTGFAKTCIALSGGALGVSLTFIREIIGPDAAEGLWLLATSWGLFVVSLVLVLLSYLVSEREIGRQIDAIDLDLSSADEERPEPTRRAAAMNVAAAATFVGGASLLIGFALMNLM